MDIKNYQYKKNTKYNKIIFKISVINNFTNLRFYNFFVLSSDFCCIQEKIIIQFTCYITDILRKSPFKMSQEKLKNIHYFESYSKSKKALNFCFFSNAL